MISQVLRVRGVRFLDALLTVGIAQSRMQPAADCNIPRWALRCSSVNEECKEKAVDSPVARGL